MTKTTLEALNKSIEHWTRLSTEKAEEGEGIGVDYCALCQEFYSNEGCKGCPVAARIKDDYCVGSPYDGARNAFMLKGLSSAEFKNAAKKELKFLQSLLIEKPEKPEKTKKVAKVVKK